MSVAARIIALQIEHAVDGHDRPRWECPDCGSELHAQALVATAEQSILGRCHEPGTDHAWYHRHGSTWCRPAEARGFA